MTNTEAFCIANLLFALWFMSLTITMHIIHGIIMSTELAFMIGIAIWIVTFIKMRG